MKKIAVLLLFTLFMISCVAVQESPGEALVTSLDQFPPEAKRSYLDQVADQVESITLLDGRTVTLQVGKVKIGNGQLNFGRAPGEYELNILYGREDHRGDITEIYFHFSDGSWTNSAPHWRITSLGEMQHPLALRWRGENFIVGVDERARIYLAPYP